MKHSPSTIGELTRELPEGRQKEGVLRAKQKASRVVSGADFDRYRISSIDEMGDAAGLCHMGSREVEIRRDIVETQHGINEMAAHVMGHEAFHAKGCPYDGVVELVVTQTLGGEAVPAYREKAETAKEISDVIGFIRLKALAVREDSDEAIRGAYIQERFRSSGSLEVLEDAAEEIDGLLKRAA